MNKVWSQAVLVPSSDVIEVLSHDISVGILHAHRMDGGFVRESELGGNVVSAEEFVPRPVEVETDGALIFAEILFLEIVHLLKERHDWVSPDFNLRRGFQVESDGMGDEKDRKHKHQSGVFHFCFSKYNYCGST